MPSAMPDQAKPEGRGSSNRLMAKIAAYEDNLRNKIEKGLCRLPIYNRYRNAAIVDLLRSVTAIIDDNNLGCVVTGGLAYDALRGRLTRVHHDLDLLCLGSNRTAILAAFSAAGFFLEEKSVYHAKIHSDNGLHADLFFWIETGEQYMEHICGGILVRIPQAFVAPRQTAYLNGMRLALPGNDYLKSIKPFVERDEDRRFLDELAADHLVECDERREVVVRRITLTVHEFTVSPEP